MEDELQAVILGGGDDEDIEFVIINNILMDRGNIPAEPVNFNLVNFSDEEVKQNFRFLRNDIPRLVRVLGLPEEVVTGTQNRVSGLTALCILLRRLTYPNRLADTSICPMFGLSPQSISQIIKTTTNIIYEHCRELLENLNNLGWLDRVKMRYYAQAIHAKEAAVANCWGFIDGTARPICRPSVFQEQYYSGHKRQHCLKYQSVLSPDGIIVSLKGPFLGRRHDAGIFRESMLYDELEAKAAFAHGEHYCLYGDQAYGLMELLLTPFPGRIENLLPHQLLFNQSMKVMRVAVEWGFQKIVTQFAFLDFKKNQKLLLQDLEKMYKVGVILTNCYTCLYGSQTSMYFQCQPPTLNEYFGVD